LDPDDPRLQRHIPTGDVKTGSMVRAQMNLISKRREEQNQRRATDPKQQRSGIPNFLSFLNPKDIALFSTSDGKRSGESRRARESMRLNEQKPRIWLAMEVLKP